MFNVILLPLAHKFLQKCPKETSRRILKKFEELSKDPFLSGSKRILGKQDKVFRVRVGLYRILYVVVYEQNKILISDIDKRSRVYN
jgi:mRNA-degrading endonuclease RelE of RelBE toxin-antitoxin system